MKSEDSLVEKRLHNMKRFYLKVTELIDSLPEGIPDKRCGPC